MLKSFKVFLFLCLITFETLANTGYSFRSFGKLNLHSQNDNFEKQNSVSKTSFSDNAQLSDSAKKEVNRAHTLADLVAKEQRLVNKLDSSSLMEYPVGIVSQGNDINYAIILNKDEITTEGSFLTAYMSFKVPQSDDSLAFIARDIMLNADGGIQGDVKLELVNNATIDIGKDIKLNILGGEGNSYVMFNCNGFKSMTIAASVEFSPNVFLCENPVTGDTIKDKQLKTTFSTTIDNWNNLLVSLSVDPFQIKSITGFGFEVKQLVLDFSDYNNPLGITFPKDYAATYFPDGNMNLWRGLYIKEAVVRLPKELKRQNGANGSERVSIGGYNMIIDHAGFSGVIRGENILTREEGNMNGWPFTVESIMVGIETNNLVEAGFKGRFFIPVLDSALLYEAMIGLNGDYKFAVTTTNKNSFNVWAAELELYPNSSIEISSVDGVFKPKAKLNGKLSINASLSKESKETDKNKSISLADITFENFQLQTDKPYIQSGVFTFGSEKAQQSMAKFPLQITKLGATISDERASLTIGVKLSVSGESENGIAIAGSATIIGERKVVDNKTRWKYKSVEVSELAINASVGPIKVDGSLNFFKEDVTYGDGFQGKVAAEFGMGIKAQAMALFGKVNDYRYWFVDAMISFSSGQPIFSGFGIYGFGGGAYSHMKQQGYTETTGSLGKSLSGITYIPDKTTFLGLKAAVAIGTYPKNEPFNGDVGYEIAFNNNMGVRYMTFTGNGYFMTPPEPPGKESLQKGAKNIASGGNGAGDQDKSTAKGSVRALVYVNYDFEHDVLHGNFKVYVNVNGIIRGVNPNDLAGEAVFHFEKSEWYVYIGTPSQTVGITLLNIIKTQSYFMLGTKIPGSPPPPENVTQKLSNPKYGSYMDDLNALGNGKGIAFGSRLSMNTGDVTFLMFYANMAAGIGFDIALKNYGNATCAGSTSPIGINGWYANGQAYAYLEGKIGIRVKLFMIEKKATILEGGVAAILQAKMPNPLWMQGAVVGYFDVLGGLVKGNFNFEFTLGEECKIVGGSALSNLGVIADLTPSENSNDISVFNAPQAVFNYEINKPFQLVDLDNIKKTFRIKLDEFSIYNGSSTLVANQEWNSNKNVLALKPTDILPGKKKLKLKAQVSFEQYKSGKWETVTDNGRQLIETKEAEFETGVAPDYIPLNNVSYSYPIINQMNYYKDESTSGYVQLTQGQDELFVAPQGYAQKGRFTSITTGKKYYFGISYNTTGNTVNFTRPTGLPNDDIMRFELVNLPTAQAVKIDANVDSVITKVNNTSSGNDISVKTQDAEGEITDLKEKVILSTNFRVSKYNKFSEKLAASSNIKGLTLSPVTNVEVLYNVLTVTETFDKYEIHGARNIFPLVSFTADLTGNNWYLDNMYKFVYKNYPLTSLLTLNDSFGVPPIRAIYINQANDYKILTEDDITNGKTDRISKYSSFAYNLPYYMFLDLNNLKDKIVNNYWNKLTNPMKDILNARPKLLTNGTYKFNVYYVLPGQSIYNSKTQMNPYIAY